MLSEELLDACEDMVHYAIGSGRSIPASVVSAVDTARVATRQVPPNPIPVADLAAAYDQLVEIVAPATPRSIEFLYAERGKRKHLPTFGSIRVIRNLIVAATVSLALFVVLALSSEIDPDIDLARDSGKRLLVNLLFLLAAAGMGAAFGALFSANQYIANGTFDPNMQSSFWARFLLGLIAGLVLSQMIPLGEANGEELTKPLLALVGGYSAKVLDTVLRRLTETVESLVRGSAREMVEAQAAGARARATEQLIRARLRTATGVIQAREKLASGADAAAVQAQLDQLLASLLPGDLAPPEPVPAPPAVPAPAATVAAGTGAAEEVEDVAAGVPAPEESSTTRRRRGGN